MALPRFSFSGGATEFFQPNQALFRTTFTPSDKLQSDTYQAEAKAYKDAVEKHNEALKVNPNVDPPKPTPLSFTQEEFDQFGVDASRRAQQLQNARQNAFNAITNPGGFSQHYGIGSLGFEEGGAVPVNFVGTGEFPETESSVGYRTGPASQDKELPLAAELLVDFTPVVGDVKAGIEAADYFNKGEYGNAALAGVGVLPFVPPLVSMTKKFKGKPKATAERLLTGEDGKPQRFYHGTREEFKEFDSDAPYTFVSDEPSTAEYYAGEIGRHDDKAPNIRPVYLKDANFFDVDNSDHLKQLRESNWYKSQKQELDVGWTRGPGEGDFVDQVEAGDYNTIEDSGLIDWIKSQDFDGFTTYEQDGKNFAVFNVEDIVNGVVKKKEGGAVGAGIASLRPSETSMGLAPYGVRHSGEGLKGKGYFGEIQSPSGQSVTEYSLYDEDIGEYPSIVPTLTAEELQDTIRRSSQGEHPSVEVIMKARMYAKDRLSDGKSTFSGPTELRFPVPSNTDDDMIRRIDAYLEKNRP
jgi:hypothetical protein